MSIHNADKKLEALRNSNKDLEALKQLDQYLQQKLDNPNQDHHYRHLHNAKQIIKNNPEEDFTEISEDLFSKVLSQIERSTYSQKTDSFSTSTKNKYRKTLDYLLKMQGFNFSDYALPGVNIYQKKTDQSKTRKDKLLDPENLNQFLRKVGELSADRQKLRNEAFYYTLWNTGARTGGVLQIKLDTVKVRNDVVEVSVPQHKDSPERPDLPLYFAAPVLKRYVETLPDDQEYLFESREGKRLGYRHVRDKANQVYKDTPELDVEYKKQPLHIFRKSFKTYAAIMGLFDDPGELDIWTGHSLGATQIKRLYDRRDTGAAAAAMRQSLDLETRDQKDWKKVLAPQTCKDCQARNSSHRTQCFSCGGVLKKEELPSQVTTQAEEEIQWRDRLLKAMQKNPEQVMKTLEDNLQ